jgi:hypothetical protein
MQRNIAALESHGGEAWKRTTDTVIFSRYGRSSQKFDCDPMLLKSHRIPSLRLVALFWNCREQTKHFCS